MNSAGGSGIVIEHADVTCSNAIMSEEIVDEWQPFHTQNIYTHALSLYTYL